jgi:proline iminopeptidase
MTQKTLFPEIEPHNTGTIQVSDLHMLYYEEVGNPDGKPVLFLHGGPGGGLQSNYRRFFDPEFYRIILFDQRGAGKSTPRAEVRENTTWDLVGDIEKIRKNLRVDRWVVFGGSWGSTLALAYAISHPDQVLGMILRGIFLCRKSEIDWFYQEGASQIFPDAWEKYLAPIPVSEQDNLVSAYHKRLMGDDPAVRLEAARAWSIWEASTSSLMLNQDAIDTYGKPEKALPFARIECHYFMHNAFMESDDYLLDRAAEIHHIPCRIVQGRYDIVCPLRTAWELSAALPKGELRIVPDAGHSVKEPGILQELVQATEHFKELYD